MESWRNYLVVGAGGMVGAVTRYWLSGFFKIGVDSFPYGTLLINLTGSFILSLFLTLTSERYQIAYQLRLFFATGVIGAYTTFSTFSSEVLTLWRAGSVLVGLIYSLASLLGGLLLVWVGFVVASQINRPPPK